MNYKDYIKQNNINTTSEFEEYLKEIHSKHYMGTDDSMPDKYDDWLSRLDTSELIYYADDFKTLAEQSLVQRVIEYRDELPVQDKDGTIDEYYNAQANACENIIRLLSTPKPKGDK